MAPSFDHSNANIPLAMAIAGFAGVAWYIALEIVIRVYLTFKRYSGLYFYSLQFAAFGVIMHALSFIIHFFGLTDNKILSVSLIIIAWVPLVTGQSLVLYSRLHLLVRDQRRLKLLLWMIICDAVIFHTTTAVFKFGSNLTTLSTFEKGFNVVQKIQMTVFSLQELILSSVYAYETREALKPRRTFQKKRVTKAVRQLMYINFIIIVMDLILLAFEYANLYEHMTTIKPAIYGLKLRLEFPVLNQLTKIFCNNPVVFMDATSSNDRSQVRREFDSKSAPDAEGGHETARKGYSVYAGAKTHLDDSDIVDRNSVIATTTEVKVTHSRRRSEDEQPIYMGEWAPGKNRSHPIELDTLGQSRRRVHNDSSNVRPTVPRSPSQSSSDVDSIKPTHCSSKQNLF